MALSYKQSFYLEARKHTVRIGDRVVFYDNDEKYTGDVQAVRVCTKRGECRLTLGNTTLDADHLSLNDGLLDVDAYLCDYPH